MGKLDHITVTEMLKCLMVYGCRKGKNRFEIETFVVLTEYLEQHPDCNRYKRKASKSKRSSSWRNQSYLLSFSNIWKPYHGAINIRPRNLRTALERYFRFHRNYKQFRVEAYVKCRNSMSNFEIYFPLFSEAIHTILKIFSQHGFRKSR